jgi:hypothetical protein
MEREARALWDFVHAYGQPQISNPKLKSDNRSAYVVGLVDLRELVKKAEKISASEKIPMTTLRPEALAEGLLTALQPYQEKWQ